ncbi:hypothetical protein OKW30_006320 [Paraburkholderia sp. Clong3]|uniref:hypothetical protein n=1 Tax=unclassified Paraburkholderia TaxID=2615204 RepID=UPI00160F772A|nr:MULTISPECIES: hypothetical protein [unclassified Paraburkholderia]MBB5467456.1 hypothetical protein [Paraburkholderia sp. CI2]MBC8720615.1 hypothetical protein [Paraburkholderia sp. 31.1]
MDTAILSSIVAGSAALLGGALTAVIQMQTQRSNHRFQIEQETLKRNGELREKEKALALERLATVHRQLTAIGREFSQDSIDINWRAEMGEYEYDQRYLSIRKETDELRMICGLYEPSLYDDVEMLHGEMNLFWGNFKNVLYLTAHEKRVDHTTPCLDRAHSAAMEISRQTSALKARLAERARHYRSAG